MMTFSIQTLRSQLQTWNPFSEKEKLKQLKKGSDKRYSYQIKEHHEFKFDVDQEDLRTALMSAEDPTDPRRALLLQVYRETLRDLHVRSQIETAVNKVLSPAWAIVDEETYVIDEARTRLMQKMWFEKARRLFVMEEFEGFKLGEFGQFKETKNGWELIDIKEFPPEYVLPKKGMIIANPQGQTGIPFRPDELPQDASNELKQLAEDAASFFIEIGDRENLGLLQYVSPNSIYKKYAKADWARSSEKWIDPVTIIRSNSDSDEENDKKAESAQNMGNNSWMILDIDDEVEFAERKNASGFQTTKEFLLYLDSDNSKGINGQVATADEKAFVGSAEVQERILDNYTDRRIRSMTYWLNEEVIPKLIELNDGNTAYSQLEGFMFMPLDILGEEEDEEDPPEDEEGTPQNRLNPRRGSKPGKQRNPEGYGLAIDVEDCCSDSHDPAVVINKLDSVLEKFIKSVYARKIRPGRISQEVSRANADKIWTGMKRAFDNNLTNVKFGSAEHRLKVQLRYNVFVMAAFKNHHNTLELHNLLWDGKGKLKNFSKFKKDVLAINDKYNVNWLNAEYKLSRANARMASKWMVHKSKGGSLVYVAVLDGNARPEHEVLHGATYPVDHEFWETYYPPNGWGCRCDVRRIRKEVVKDPESLPPVKPEHRNNPGITGKVFNSDHPYFEVAKEFEKQANEIFGFDLPVNLDRFNSNMAIYNTLKNDASYNRRTFFTESGGFVFRHKNLDKRDYKLNDKAAEILAKKGYAVEILEHRKVGGINTPELRISGELTDLKTPSKVKGIKTAFYNARKQGLDNVVIEVRSQWKVADIIQSIDDGFFFNEKMIQATILWKGEVIEITRKDYLDGKLMTLIK